MGNISSYITSDLNIKYKKYGWVRDLPDARDVYCKPNFTNVTSSIIDLRDHCPGIYNQGKLGSCTANAIAAAYEYDEIKQNINNLFIPSRLFIYYNERCIEHTEEYDSGARIRDGVKTVASIGVCPETDWPYNTSMFSTKPYDKCYTVAARNKSRQYKRISHDINHLKACLSEGIPVIFGFAVYKSFEDDDIAKTGIMKMPGKTEPMLGGHAVLLVGYNDDKETCIVRNSWGVEWGDKGYFYMPYEFITNKDMCSDFWIIETVEDSP